MESQGRETGTGKSAQRKRYRKVCVEKKDVAYREYIDDRYADRAYGSYGDR